MTEKIMLTDTHAHLYWDSFKEDFNEMIQRTLDAGVTTLINVGVDVEKSEEAVEQAQNTNWPKKMSVYSTIGIHPHEAVKYSSNPDVSIREDINKLRELYQSSTSKVVAVGECGLDFLFESNPNFVPSSLAPQQIKDLQQKLFQAQIDLAKELKLPLIVHCRDDRSKNPENSEAWDEVLKMAGDYPTILHCYSGLLHTTYSILHTTNLYVSFAATITYPKNEFLREAAKILPLEKIILETDCPFLPPQSKRGQRNEPSSVLEIAQLIADLKGISLEKVADQTTKNVRNLLSGFKISTL